MTNWDELRNEYVSGTQSLRVMAKQHEVPFGTLQKRCRTGGWVAARKKYRTDKAKTVLKKLEAKQSNAEVNHLMDVQQAGLIGASKILALIEEMDEYRNPQGQVSTSAIRDLTSALKEINLILRSAFDIPTRAQLAHLEVEREKLELEKRRLNQFDRDESETGIIVIPEVEIDDEDSLETTT